MTTLSPRRRKEVINALRRGTVPFNGLDVLAVGLERFQATVDDELATAGSGGAVFKAVRGEYGSGKTFFARWLGERAKRAGMAVAEVQISETETPLHRLETVYRRVCESLQTAEFPPSALREVLDAWLFSLEQEAGAEVDTVLERRLAAVSRTTPAFAAVLRAYRSALAAGDLATAEGLVAWLGGQPHVAAKVRRSAGVRGELDHFGAFGFFQGLLTVLRDSGHPGLLLVLDEVETLQRARADVRDKALNALRQLLDEVDAGRFPGLYLLITGTPAFFEGPQGAQRLAPLAQRLATDFSGDPRFDNPRAVQVRLPGFTQDSLREVGARVRELFASDATDPQRITRLVDEAYLADLAAAVSGRLGGKVGVAPRLFLKKLVGEVLDRVDQFPDFDPRTDYTLLVATAELSEVERNAAAADEVTLDLP
ncbi:MAG: BREX system ATP-binding protein BrxD [Dactylosporangium sp.]|nr:BREX system ATP-binding protein BrxD [Dactylosporangium sp.]NNJ60727.1 BREX system ATP-binding protein BrxD [Dactylosporangium sp.]